MKNKEKRKTHPVAAFCSALGTVLLILVVVAAAPAAVPRAFGLQVYEVISGSMAPEIPTGSLVYVRKAKAEQIQAEDVIAYDGGGGALLTHRVVENRTLMGEFVTKGDANEKEDPNPVSYDQLRGQVVYSIPYLGWIAGLLSETTGKLAAAGMIAAAVLLHVAAGMMFRKTES